MIASLKCQYAELLSDIGFIKTDLTARKIGRLAPRTGDGVLAATGEEVCHWGGDGNFGMGTPPTWSRVGMRRCTISVKTTSSLWMTLMIFDKTTIFLAEKEFSARKQTSVTLV